MMLLTAVQQGQIALDAMMSGVHRPFIDGKCNREKLHNVFLVGMMKGELPPMDQKDAEMIFELIDSLIEEYN